MTYPPPPEPSLLLAVALELVGPLLVFDLCWLATLALSALERLAHP